MRMNKSIDMICYNMICYNMIRLCSKSISYSFPDPAAKYAVKPLSHAIPGGAVVDRGRTQ